MLRRPELRGTRWISFAPIPAFRYIIIPRRSRATLAPDCPARQERPIVSGFPLEAAASVCSRSRQGFREEDCSGRGRPSSERAARTGRGRRDKGGRLPGFSWHEPEIRHSSDGAKASAAPSQDCSAGSGAQLTSPASTSSRLRGVVVTGVVSGTSRKQGSPVSPSRISAIRRLLLLRHPCLCRSGLRLCCCFDFAGAGLRPRGGTYTSHLFRIGRLLVCRTAYRGYVAFANKEKEKRKKSGAGVQNGRSFCTLVLRAR